VALAFDLLLSLSEGGYLEGFLLFLCDVLLIPPKNEQTVEVLKLKDWLRASSVKIFERGIYSVRSVESPINVPALCFPSSRVTTLNPRSPTGELSQVGPCKSLFFSHSFGGLTAIGLDWRK